MRVAVAMSGGVDSSVAALLLREQGHDVFGLTMLTSALVAPESGLRAAAESPAAVDARNVSRQLGIEHHVVDLSGLFEDRVVAAFLREYRCGRTPNPCALCNEEVKFGALWAVAAARGAAALATGHYARIEHLADGQCLLLRGANRAKDQSYFLHRLSQEQLARTLFPCGDLTKQETRGIARSAGLQTHDRAESQEICFVPGQDHAAFLREHIAGAGARGEIQDSSGRCIGTHPGVAFFTVGQRRGLSIGGRGEPLYVIRIDPAANRIIVGPARELYRNSCRVTDVRWTGAPAVSALRADVQPRHRHPGAPAWVRPGPDRTAHIEFDTAQRALAPGQAAVFYDNDRVLGGGWMEPEE